MNKDVVYIEPEDDITDIITKIENSKEKIVALVPPKKAGVFRSIVNIKLIAKAGFTADKTIVLVTTDPSITKLAAATKIPVTKNLQTAPTIPSIIDDEGSTSKEELVEEDDGEVSSEEVEEEPEEEKEEDPKESDKKDSKAEAKESIKKAKEKSKEVAKNAKKFSLAWMKAHKPLVICSVIGLILIILFFVWAFVIAPAVTINVGIRTTTNNFSKSATFVKSVDAENIDEAKFHLIEKKIENESGVEFEATGKKNIGEKAKGSVVIYTHFAAPNIPVDVKKGATFTLGDKSFIADEDVRLVWNGAQDTCENYDKNKYPNDPVISNGKINCLISGRVKVTAKESGTAYNIAASSANWKSSVNAAVYSDAAMAGGTDKEITVVSQEDVNRAKENLALSSEAEYKEKLMDVLENDDFPIDSSFKHSIGDPDVVPAVGEEVKEGVTPKITVKITDTIYLIDKTKVEEFIGKEANLSENFKIYQMNDPFVENFTETTEGFSGKIKTSYVSGPKVTENDVIEIVKGKGLGEAQHDLKDIDGISKISIDKSYPWVTSIPGDPNKITVILDVEK